MAALLCACAICGTGLRAQEADPEEFSGHWFIQLQGGIGQTVGETSFGNLISPGASIGFGYRFTPVWGLRATAGGWEAKGALTGPTAVYSFNYLQGSVDAVADICGIFSGYREKRTLSPYIFAGAGLNVRFNNDGALSMSGRFPDNGFLWSGPHFAPAGRFGLGTGIRISDAVSVNLEIDANFLSDKFNSKQGSAVDWQLGARAGLTFNIGMRKASKPKAAAQEPVPVPVRATESRPEPEPETQEKTGAAQEQIRAAQTSETPTPEPQKPEFQIFERNILFAIGKSDIRAGEQAKLAELTDILRKNPGTAVTVTGHADAATGTHERNMELSRERAENVAAALRAAGIEAGRIVVLHVGDTDNRFDSPEQNRVAICIVEAE